MITLTNHSIAATVSQRYASIEYSYDFQNFGNVNGSKELKFEITIDPHAFISHFIADIDGEIFYGKTKEKEEAKEEYKEAKEKNENAILISKPYKNISNVFEISTNIDKDSKISLQISIEQYLAKKFNFNQLNIQILRNFEKYNIYPTFENILFKLDIKDNSAIFDIIIPSSNTSSPSSIITGNTSSATDIVIDNKTMDKLNTHCSISGKIHSTTSSVNELTLKYKTKGEQNDSTIIYDNKSHTFCHIISDVISESMITDQQNNTIHEGDADNIEIKSNILIPRRVLFVIDKSGSMSGSKWNKTISATIIALRQLRICYDRYGVLFFNDKVNVISGNEMRIANEGNINENIHYLQNEKAGGSTNINDALIKAIQLIECDIISLNKDESDTNFFMNQIIFITDGEPNRGETDTKQIILNVQKANDLRNIDKYSSKICIFSFGVGKDTNDSGWINDLNHSFLKLLSLNNNGEYQRIKQSHIDTALTEYYSILSKPVLSNINIKYDGNCVRNLTQTSFNTLYSGNDLIICGQIDPNQEENIGEQKDNEKSEMNITATISAVTGHEMNNDDNKQLMITKAINISKKLKIELDSDGTNNENIERVWAYLKLQEFSRQKLIGVNEQKTGDILEITPLSLAMKHKFVTPWTSMIVVKKKKNIFEEKDKEYGALLSGIREHKMKLVTIGDGNCGKTSLILRFVENVFNINNSEVTLDINCKNKKLKINNNYCSIDIWDTVGQEKYSKHLAPMYLRNTNGVIFVCDINSMESIHNITEWAQSISQTINFDKNNAILVVNKSDLIDNGNDAEAMIKIRELTTNLGINYVVTSAKDNINVKNSFYKLIESIYDTMFADKGNTISDSVSQRFDNTYYRGDRLDNLVSRSIDLGQTSRMFHSKAMKKSACC